MGQVLHGPRGALWVGSTLASVDGRGEIVCLRACMVYLSS